MCSAHYIVAGHQPCAVRVVCGAAIGLLHKVSLFYLFVCFCMVWCEYRKCKEDVVSTPQHIIQILIRVLQHMVGFMAVVKTRPNPIVD